MNDFTYESMGICYWNGDLGSFNIGVVGTGSALKVLAHIIYNEAFRGILARHEPGGRQQRGQRGGIRQLRHPLPGLQKP